MSDTSDLTTRLTAALDRIADAAETLPAPQDAAQVPAADVDALNAELEAERAANEQLEERVRAIMERQESVVARLEQEVKELKAALVARDGSVRHVRQTNGKLRQSNRALRTANAQGLADPALINAAMEAELEALRLAQAADRAELDDILSVIEPIVGGATHA